MELCPDRTRRYWDYNALHNFVCLHIEHIDYFYIDYFSRYFSIFDLHCRFLFNIPVRLVRLLSIVFIIDFVFAANQLKFWEFSCDL